MPCPERHIAQPVILRVLEVKDLGFGDGPGRPSPNRKYRDPSRRLALRVDAATADRRANKPA